MTKKIESMEKKLDQLKAKRRAMIAQDGRLADGLNELNNKISKMWDEMNWMEGIIFKLETEFEARKLEANKATWNGKEFKSSTDVLCEMLKSAMLQYRADIIEKPEYLVRRDWLEDQITRK